MPPRKGSSHAATSASPRAASQARSSGRSGASRSAPSDPIAASSRRCRAERESSSPVRASREPMKASARESAKNGSAGMTVPPPKRLFLRQEQDSGFLPPSGVKVNGSPADPDPTDQGPIDRVTGPKLLENTVISPDSQRS